MPQLIPDDFLFIAYRPENKSWYIIYARPLGNVPAAGPFVTEDEAKLYMQDPTNAFPK